MRFNTEQKMKFSMKDFSSKYDQIRTKLRIWSHLLEKCLKENFIFCAVIQECTVEEYSIPAMFSPPCIIRMTFKEEPKPISGNIWKKIVFRFTDKKNQISSSNSLCSFIILVVSNRELARAFLGKNWVNPTQPT